MSKSLPAFRKCPQCSYGLEDIFSTRCPRCHKSLLDMCSCRGNCGNCSEKKHEGHKAECCSTQAKE